MIMPRNGDLLGKTWHPVRVHYSTQSRVDLCTGVTDWGYSSKLYYIQVFGNSFLMPNAGRSLLGFQIEVVIKKLTRSKILLHTV